LFLLAFCSFEFLIYWFFNVTEKAQQIYALRILSVACRKKSGNTLYEIRSTHRRFLERWASSFAGLGDWAPLVASIFHAVFAAAGYADFCLMIPETK